MAEVIILGSASSVPDEKHENAHFAIRGTQKFILVDCAGSPLVRLQQAGLDIQDLSDIILTHFHPDHVSGVPLLLMNMWLLGRSDPLTIHGLEYTLERMKHVMNAFGWSDWPNFFPVHFHRLPEDTLTLALETDEFRVFTSIVDHLIPTVGLRVEAQSSGSVLAYSCDTQPCDAVVELASRADVLIHEATGQALGHSTARQAGEIAQKAYAGKLYLIHYPVLGVNPLDLLPQARQTFVGEVALAEDFMVIEL